MSAALTDAEGTVTGNTYDKYGSANPVVRRLMARFERAVDELWALASPRSVLDVGCGEGVLTARWADQLGTGRVVGIDLEDPKLEREWAQRSRPNLEFRAMSAESLAFGAGEFDLACRRQVLRRKDEHLVAQEGAIHGGKGFVVEAAPDIEQESGAQARRQLLDLKGQRVGGEGHDAQV